MQTPKPNRALSEEKRVPKSGNCGSAIHDGPSDLKAQRMDYGRCLLDHSSFVQARQSRCATFGECPFLHFASFGGRADFQSLSERSGHEPTGQIGHILRE